MNTSPGHRKRLRERFLRAGESGLHDHELIELLLTYAIPRKDTKAIAKKLLDRFGTMNGILEAEQGELREIDGLGPASVALLKLIHTLNLKSLDPIIKRTDVLKSPGTVADYFRKRMRKFREERFVVAVVDTRNKVIDIKELQYGTVDQAVVYPRRVVEFALERRARGVIIIHNHPSGECAPSREDHRITGEIRNALNTVSITLLDHVIVGTEDHFSFKDAGLL